MLQFKIVLAGAKNVGKSSLLARFCDDIFDEKMMDTIGVAFKRKKMQVDEMHHFDLAIWDFGGEKKYRIVFPQYIKGASAVLILYDATREDTINDVYNWLELINNNSDTNVVKVLVATKADLINNNTLNIKKAREIAKKNDFYGEPILTSSKTGQNVEKAFRQVVEGITKIHHQKCGKCGEIFSIKLKFCNYCGTKATMDAITL
ncbi:MAG: GTP-binding protein [Candidatus Lokiarchaeota archaeon]|nr:GTP-binding protein [Candidatus Lokiarchaeota archaeon]